MEQASASLWHPAGNPSNRCGANASRAQYDDHQSMLRVKLAEGPQRCAAFPGLAQLGSMVRRPQATQFMRFHGAPPAPRHGASRARMLPQAEAGRVCICQKPLAQSRAKRATAVTRWHLPRLPEGHGPRVLQS
jgi:hypothetical protein